MITTTMIQSDTVTVNVAMAGHGPVIVLLHGFPHTWQVWEPIIPALAMSHTVIAPDLRGLGGSSRPVDGYTAADVANDVIAILDALDLGTATIIALDLGAQAAVLLALTRPERVRSLVLSEAVIGGLDGADEFQASPPWWFGFHAVPGLAESVLSGNEREYVDFFLRIGTLGAGVSEGFRAAVLDAYAQPGALQAAFAHYRSLPESALQIAAAAADNRLTMPVLTIGASTVRDITYRQIEPLADHAESSVIETAGHIIPQHQPDAFLAAVSNHLGRQAGTD
ncbi:MAG TPA: alpha/beta hydrolase [Microbacteriaceae bacterium]|jgi:pimeloyl-ACP methyl ester carboxylesterase|nr:alpha/beta hydrolase [Microbacteriaceae bacterium]